MYRSQIDNLSSINKLIYLLWNVARPRCPGALRVVNSSGGRDRELRDVPKALHNAKQLPRLNPSRAVPRSFPRRSRQESLIFTKYVPDVSRKTNTTWPHSPELTKAAADAKLFQSCLTVCDPIDGSPPGSAIPGILQARTLERVAISFSSAWKWKAKVKSLSHVRLFTTPWTAAYQAPPSMGFSRQSRVAQLQGVNFTLKDEQYQHNNMVHKPPPHLPPIQGWMGKQIPFPDWQTRSLSQLQNHPIIWLRKGERGNQGSR